MQNKDGDEVIALFDGGYGRVGEIWIETKQECDVCGAKNVTTLGMDGSDQEYRGGFICKPCIDTAFLGFK